MNKQMVHEAVQTVEVKLEELRSCIGRMDAGELRGSSHDAEEAYGICDSIQQILVNIGGKDQPSEVPWHPPSWNCLSAAQRRNLRLLALQQVRPTSNLQRKSLLSLAGHGLATVQDKVFTITNKGREWASHL